MNTIKQYLDDIENSCKKTVELIDKATAALTEKSARINRGNYRPSYSSLISSIIEEMGKAKNRLFEIYKDIENLDTGKTENSIINNMKEQLEEK
ncbi:MAG: hypothetical protein ABIC04_07945 [Nanoarchaeota archaeon]